VALDEYPGEEGFIHISEVASGWVKNIRRWVRLRQKVVCKVLGVDEAKAYVDLSLKRVNEHQRRAKMGEWKNEIKARNLMGIVAERLGKSVEECYRAFGDALIERYDSLYAALEDCAANPEALKDWGGKGWVPVVVLVASENISFPSVSIAGSLEITCPLPDGVEHVRHALEIVEHVGEEGEEEEEVSVQYVGAPHYHVLVRAPDYKTAERILTKATQEAIAYIEGNGGKGKFQR